MDPRRHRLFALAPLVAVLWLPPPAAAQSRALTVAPGEIGRVAEAASPCPTFHWAAVEGAAGYEVVVLDLGRQDEPVVVLRRSVAGSAFGWTPGRADCLAAGGLYAWTLRALDAAGTPLGGEAAWAEPRRFSVPSLPSEAELLAALAAIRGRRAGEVSHATAALAAAEPRRGDGLPSGEAVEVSGVAAIRGENPASSGANHGVLGQSASAAGGGLVGINLAAGPDLVLDGAAQGQADTLFTESGIDRPAGAAQTFNIQNSQGDMTLEVDGTAVSLLGHLHAGEEIVAGTVADARIAATLARDSEVMPIVLAADGPESGLDADTLDGVHGAGFQVRVTGTCPAGQTVQAVLANGGVVCSEAAVPPLTSTVDDPSNQVGLYPSIAIGVDGFPVISYGDNTAASLKVAKCQDSACTGPALVVTVDDPATASVGYDSSLKIGIDGFPVISYRDSTAKALKVAKCFDGSCSGGAMVSTVDDPANEVGMFTSLAMGTDGLPVISYLDSTAAALKVAKCGNGACSFGSVTITTVDDPVNEVGFYSSIAIGTDGFPVISYWDMTAGSLKVAKCNNASCTMPATITTVDDPVNLVGEGGTSIAIGADGNPVISYRDGTAQSLKVAKCDDPACAGGGETITTVDDDAHDVGWANSIAIGADGNPVISYTDITDFALKVAKCNDPACAGGDEVITIVDDPVNWVGAYTSLAIGTDGFPVIAYTDATAHTLRVTKCQNASCRH